MEENISLINDLEVKPTKISSHKCSFQKSFNNILMANLGISILAMGYGIKVSGIFISLPVFIFVYSIGIYSSLVLDNLAKKINFDAPSLLAFSDKIGGKPAIAYVFITLIIASVGPAASYFIYFVDLINKNACKHQIQYLCEDKNAIMSIALIIIIGLSLIPTLNNYSYISMLGNLFLAISYGIIAFYAFEKYDDEGNGDINYFRIQGFPTVFAISCFSLATNTIIFEIRKEIEEIEQFPKLMKTSYLATGIVTYLLPLLFYIGFRKTTKAVVLFNLPIEEMMGSSAQILYGLTLIFSFPLVLFPIYSACEFTFKENTTNMENISEQNNLNDSDKFTFSFFLMRISISLSVFLIAYFLEEILIIIELGGSFAASSLIFIIPFASYEYFYFRNPEVERNYNKSLNFTILIIGIIATIFNTIYSFVNFIKK